MSAVGFYGVIGVVAARRSRIAKRKVTKKIHILDRPFTLRPFLFYGRIAHLFSRSTVESLTIAVSGSVASPNGGLASSG